MPRADSPAAAPAPAPTLAPAPLLVRLRGLRPSLSPAEDRVAEQVLADARAAAALTISELAVIVASVRFEEAQLLTLYEEDIGVPIALRTLTGTAFAAEAVDAVAYATGAELVDVGVPCYEAWVGSLTVGDQRAECVFMHTPARAIDVPLRDLLTVAKLSPNFERELAIYAS